MKMNTDGWKQKIQTGMRSRDKLGSKEFNVKKLILNAFSKEKKAKRVMKQKERGILMILGSLVFGYATYTFLYEPINQERSQVQEMYAQSQKRVLDIQTQLDNQTSLLKSINLYTEKLKEYKLKYPNYRTENEILKVVENVLAKESKSPATFVKGMTKQALKSTIYTFIGNKSLNSMLSNEAFFNVVKDDNAKDSSSQNKDTEIPEEDQSNFEYTEVSFSVEDVTKQQGIRIMNDFYEYERVIIPESWKLIDTSKDGKYRLEATVLFFAYRDDDQAEPLF